MVYGQALSGQALPSSSWLASTADRERAVDVLRAGFAEGRLTREEFDERAAQAYASRTYGELDELTADLPAGPLGALPVMGSAPVMRPGPVIRSAPASMRQEPGTRPVTSTAGLVLTALVVFTLAALVTSVAVYLHSHGYGYGYGYGFARPPGQIHLMPQVFPLKSAPGLQAP